MAERTLSLFVGPYRAEFTFTVGSDADADALWGSLVVEADDAIPNVTAKLSREGRVLLVRLSSPDLGDLRAATKSYLTRVRAAVGALDVAAARKER